MPKPRPPNADARRTNDSVLWYEASRGSPIAFGTLFERHARAVYNHCFRRTGNWSLAEDLTSAVFLEAWRKRRDVLLHDGSLLPWLLGVATNLLRNHKRSLRRHQRALARLPIDRESADDLDDVIGRIEDERQLTVVLALVDKLPRREQEVIALCVWEGLSYEAAAVALQSPVGTIRSRLSRARRRIRELLPSYGHKEDEGEVEETSDQRMREVK